MIAVFRHHPVQGIRSGLALLLAQQCKGNGADVFALAVRSDFPIVSKGGAVRLYRLFCRVAVLRCVLCLAQRLCNFCQKPPGISQIRRTHAFARVHHRLHGSNARLTPLAVVQTVQHRVLGVCPGLLFLGGLLCTAKQERIPLLHHLVVVRKDLAVAGALIKDVGRHRPSPPTYRAWGSCSRGGWWAAQCSPCVHPGTGSGGILPAIFPPPGSSPSGSGRSR